jgi:hypothetical protein
MDKHQAIFERVISDPRYLRNLDWGKPRRGHPEGTVRAHIAELEENLARLKSGLSEEMFWKLKLLIHVHDTFKAESAKGVPIEHPNSHASLGRRFLEEFCREVDLLRMVQYHDEPFALWRQVAQRGQCNQNRLRKLIENIEDWRLFLTFLLVDGCTDGKNTEPLTWALQELASSQELRETLERRLSTLLPTFR